MFIADRKVIEFFRVIIRNPLYFYRNLEMSHDSSLDPSSSNTSTDCAASHLAVQAWSERELDQLCSRQVVKDLCVQPTCDVTMATQMIYKTSHYLLAVHYSHPVFCR